MKGYVYLIRNGTDLYKIGITTDLKQRMKQLKPDQIIKTFQTDEYEDLEKKLHKKYKDVRLPQSEYFRLTSTQIADCKKSLTKENKNGIFASKDLLDINLFVALIIFGIPILSIGGLIDIFLNRSWFQIYQGPIYWYSYFWVFAAPIISLINWFDKKDDINEPLFIIWIISFSLWLLIGNFGTLAIH